MAMTQRWRRKRSAGEDLAPSDAAPVDATLVAHDDDAASRAPEGPTEPEDGDLVELTELNVQPTAEPTAEPTADLAVEPAVEVPEALTEDAAPAAQDDPENTEDPEHLAVLDAPEDTDDVEDTETTDDTDAAHPPLPTAESSGIGGWLLGGRRAAELVPLQLLQAAHAKQAITTALAMGLVAAVAGRPAREAGVILLTVLVGQTILGWHNDIVDRQRDAAHGASGKPVAAGRLQPDTVWYAIVVATLLLVPLAITTGIRAGCLYLAAVAIGMLGNVIGRTGFFSWWSWAASYALLPAYLSYGGWGGQAIGSAPEAVIVVLAALLGVGVHFMRSVWGLVADHEDGWTYLPLKLGLRLGATRLLALSTVFTAGVVIALVAVGAQVGLSR